MRHGVFAILCFTYCCASAQPVGQGNFRENPLEPSRWPLNLPRDNRLPPPQPEGGAAYEFKLIESESWSVEGNKVNGKKLKFEYRGYSCVGDEVVGDLDTNEFVLRGNVNILGADEVVQGSSVMVNFSSRTFRFDDGKMDIRSTLVKGRLLSDLYLSADRLEGGEKRLDGQEISLTSCTYDKPHFSFDADSITVLPNDRLTFRKFRLRVLNRTIITLPNITIPIRQGTREFLPDVGQSRDEGVYVKFRFGISAGDDTAFLRADLMSKKGVGLGFDYELFNNDAKGAARIYAILDPDSGKPEFTGSAKYDQKFDFGKLSVNHETRQFSYLNGPENIVSNTRIQFLPDFGKNGTSRLSYDRYSNVSPGFSSVSSSLQFSDVRRWTKTHSTNLALNLSSYIADSGTSAFEREILDVRFQDVLDLKTVTAQIDYNRAIPVGSTINQFTGIDRTPELTIRTDSHRLFGGRGWLPNFQTFVSVGNFVDNQFGLSTQRYFFDFRTSRTSSNLRGFSFDYDLGFQQGVYSDDTAQYTPRANIRIGYSLGERITANFRYNYLRQHGFTPLSLDRTGQFNLASYEMQAEIGNGLKLGGQVGFDIARDRRGEVGWQSPSLRLEYDPGSWLAVRAIANYDADAEDWSNFRFDVGWKAGSTRLYAAGTYDARLDKWGNVGIFLDGLKWGRLNFSALLQYNGFLNRFDSQQYAFTYDMHCTEAVLQVIENNSGFRPGREILFFVRIKALPFDSSFGLGRQGQPLGIGGGRSF